MIEELREVSVGLKAAGIALFSRSAAQRYLVSALGQMPGLPAKAAQLLGAKLGCSPQQPEPLSVEEVTRILERNAPSLAQHVLKLDPAFATASLGQVHEAWLKDGRHVAIKVQWPQIKDQLKEQAKRLVSLGRFSPASRFGMNWNEFEATISESMIQESNYVLEAENQEFFTERFASTLGIVIPKVIREFSNECVLVQAFEPSRSLEAIESVPADAKEDLAKLFSEFLWRSLFTAGRFHADLHPKNVGYRLNPTRLVIYDFGSCLEITKERATAFEALSKATVAADEQSIYGHLVALGFDETKLSIVRPGLLGFAKGLFGPLDWRDDLERTLGESKWWLRTAGPSWFLLAMRSVFHLKKCLRSLSPEPVEIVEDLRAKHLHVRVLENGEPIVEVELPTASVDHLVELISPEVRVKIDAQKLDLDQMRERVHKSGYIPQRIFDLIDKEKEYQVWLE